MEKSPQPLNDQSNLLTKIKDNIQTLAIALALTLIIRTFIAEPRFIPSESMVPTLWTNDRLLVEKVSYNFTEPHRGDIIVFTPPSQLQEAGFGKDQAFIKRIIGVGGDRLQVKEGVVYVNDQPLKEDYIAEPPNYDLPLIVVPEANLFVMGDNRNNSNDSHVWGFLPKSEIIGKAILRFWPLDRLGTIQ